MFEKNYAELVSYQSNQLASAETGDITGIAAVAAAAAAADDDEPFQYRFNTAVD
jgi:hypothetical protein